MRHFKDGARTGCTRTLTPMRLSLEARFCGSPPIQTPWPCSPCRTSRCAASQMRARQGEPRLEDPKVYFAEDANGTNSTEVGDVFKAANSLAIPQDFRNLHLAERGPVMPLHLLLSQDTARPSWDYILVYTRNSEFWWPTPVVIRHLCAQVTHPILPEANDLDLCDALALSMGIWSKLPPDVHVVFSVKFHYMAKDLYHVVHLSYQRCCTLTFQPIVGEAPGQFIRASAGGSPLPLLHRS
eukprot:5365246-Amphidinium_carterae.1